MALVCLLCSSPIKGRRSDAGYCSSTCSATSEKRRYRARKGLDKGNLRGPYRTTRKQYLGKQRYQIAYSRSKHRGVLPETSVRMQALALGFKSGLERSLDIQLRQSGVEYAYESLKLDYTTRHSYTPDFVLKNGIIIEAKGYFRTDAEVAKMRAIKSTYPDLDIRFVFSNPDKLVRRSKVSHGEWASRQGFPWAAVRIPQEWLDE